jgi:hypothetical protein
MVGVEGRLNEGYKTNVFLNNLPLLWRSFININSNEQNLSLQILIGRILQEEQRLKEETTPKAKDTTSALMVRKWKFKFKGKCFKFGKDGHMKANCKVKKKDSKENVSNVEREVISGLSRRWMDRHVRLSVCPSRPIRLLSVR